VEATNAMEINQKEIPTKSFGSKTADANTGVLVSPSAKKVPSAIFAFGKTELKFMISPMW
jgi:hypothetical protein